MITQIRHIGFVTKNFKKTIKLYQKMGFKEIYRNKEKWDNILLEIVKLKSNNGEIIEFLNKNSIKNNKVHLAVSVENLEEFFNEFKNKIKFYILPRLSPDKSVKLAFGKDFNGINIEFVEEIK